MRDGQPPVCPSLQSVSLRWENEDAAYLSMSVSFFTVLVSVTIFVKIITFCNMYVRLNIVFYYVQF